jgi:probable HAF family extracellular repeat protein
MKRVNIAAWSLFKIAILAAAVQAAPVPSFPYRVTDIGVFAGRLSVGLDVNAHGQVVGSSTYNNDVLLAHAFFYDGVLHDLGTLGGPYSDAAAINDQGQIVGASTLPGNVITHAYLYDGSMRDLGTLGGEFSEAYGINNAGRVVGWAANRAGIRHAFLHDGTMKDLGTLGGQDSQARDINDAGIVVGWSRTASGATRAFLHDGVMRDLGTLGGSSFAEGINAAGLIVGNSNLSNAQSHAFIWDDGVMQDLGTLGGPNSTGVAINSWGDVVGQSSRAGGSPRAMLYTRSRGMVDLNDLIDPSLGWELIQALSINDFGQIAGHGRINGQTHAFLLTPVPEPYSLALVAASLCIGGISCGSRRRVRRPINLKVR